MEMIIGCIFLVLTMAFLLYFCKNVTFTVEIKYPEPQFVEVKDPYDEDGESKIDDGEQISFDEILKEVNDLMLGEEESNG